MSYTTARIDELEEIDYKEAHMRPVRLHFGITSFGTNAWTGDPGERLVPEHEEDEGNEELYVVVQGRARFEVGEDTFDAPAGTLVHVPGQTRRTAFAEEPGTAVLAVGGRQGKAFEPHGWEVWAPLHDLYEAGDYLAVVERGRERIEAAPDSAPLYNLACCEALAGMKDEAIEHLRIAFERSPDLRELARTDSDLDALRDEAGFAELLA